MPSRESILATLALAANDGVTLAIAWHAVLAAALVALAAGWRPSARAATLALAAPLASVSAAAWGVGNPFNGAVFALLAGAMIALGARAPSARLAGAPRALCVTGALAIAFGWVYRHFLEGPPLRYLYAAPVGIVPCPTLAVVLGFALLARGFGARAAWVLVAAGTFYALFGVARLGVAIDLALLVAAAALAIAALRGPRGAAHAGIPAPRARGPRVT